MKTDPVCRMKVDPQTAPARAEYEGVVYYFCSESCRETFASDPSRYAAAARRDAPPHDAPRHGH